MLLTLLITSSPTQALSSSSLMIGKRYFDLNNHSDFLDEVATDIIHQHSERLDYYKGDFSTFQSTKDERAKNQLREYENQLAVRKHLQAFIDKFRYNAAKSSEAQSRIKKLERLPKIEPPEEETSLTFKFPEPEKLLCLFCG